MEYLIFIIAFVVTAVIIFTIMQYKNKNPEDYEEEEPKDKMYRAITILIYLIIAIILIAIIARLFFWSSILALIKG